MWRALFLAVAVFVIILGVECLGVEKVSLKIRDDPPAPGFLDTEPKLGAQKQIIPPPWAPYSLLAGGTVMCIYSFTIPQRILKT
jgi:hypothetical protein